MRRRIDATPNGPKLVGRSIRPARLAYIVGTLEHCEVLIKVCTLAWGGKHTCIVPYDVATGISDEWKRLLAAYDPDMVLSLVEMDEETEEFLFDIEKKHPRRKEDSGKRFPVWKNPVPDHVVGQSLYSALAGKGTYGRQHDFYPALVADVPQDHPLRLFIIARYGCLDETWASSISQRSNLKWDLTLEDFLQLERVTLGDSFLDFVIRGEPPRGEKPIPLLEYTLVDLAQRGQYRSFPDHSDASILYDTQHLVVVSEGLSVEDFCWFWNLRAQRYILPYHKLPLWLPRSVAETRKDDVAELLHQGKGTSFPRRFLISKSIPDRDLQKLAEKLGDGIETATDRLDRFYSSDFFVGIKDQKEVFFDEGRVRIPYPQADVVNHCRHPQFYYVDIDLPGYKLPHLNVWSWGHWNFPNYRVSRTGLSYHRLNLKDHPYIELALPSPWQLIETFAGLAGYDVELSDKGETADKLIRLVGELRDLWVLSGRTVYELFDQLSEIRQSKEFKSRLRDGLSRLDDLELEDAVQRVMRDIASDRHARKWQDFGRMKSILDFDIETARRFLKWLIQRRILFRGAELKCTFCGTKQWLYIDDFQSSMQCTGCQNVIDIPLDTNVTQWQYHINALYARAHESGVLPHLMTVSYYTNEVGPGGRALSDSIIGHFAGLKLKTREGAETPFPEIEIDVAWIEDGNLVIGECKTNGRDLSAEEVSRYLKLAQLMKCKRVIFSALDSFEDLEPKIQTLLREPPVPVELLTGDQLFDQYPGRFSESESEYQEGFRMRIRWFLDWARGASPQ